MTAMPKLLICDLCLADYRPGEETHHESQRGHEPLPRAYYTSRQEAIAREVADRLGSLVDDYNIEAIADDVLGDSDEGYAMLHNTETFWEMASVHQR